MKIYKLVTDVCCNEVFLKSPWEFFTRGVFKKAVELEFLYVTNSR